MIKKQVEGSLAEEEAISLQKWANINPKYRDFLNGFQNEKILLNDVSIWNSLEDNDEDGWEQRLERKIFFKIATADPPAKIKSNSGLTLIRYDTLISTWI